MKKWLALVSIAAALAGAAWMAKVAIELGKAPAGVVALALVGAASGPLALLLLALLVLVVKRSLGPGPAPVALVAGEKLLAEIAANHFMGIEGRGGRLVITTQRLLFRPHRFNVQLAPVAIELSEVHAVKPWLTGVRVASRGRKDRFVVANAAHVAELLSELVRTPEENRATLGDELRGLPGARRALIDDATNGASRSRGEVTRSDRAEDDR